MDSESLKMPWESPKLTMYGGVEELTAQTVKTFGYYDGISLDINGDGQGDINIGSSIS